MMKSFERVTVSVRPMTGWFTEVRAGSTTAAGEPDWPAEPAEVAAAPAGGGVTGSGVDGCGP